MEGQREKKVKYKKKKKKEPNKYMGHSENVNRSITETLEGKKRQNRTEIMY